MTPDWAARPTAVPYAVFGDPQSLNLYGYVRNDPVSIADADGHRCDSRGNSSKCGREEVAYEESETNHGAQKPVTQDSARNTICPGSCPGLKMIVDGARTVVNPKDGAVTLLGGAAQVTATVKAGFVKENSKATVSGQVLPSFGATIDVRVPAPNPANGPGGTVSGGIPVLSGALNINNGTVSGVTVSVGYTQGVGIPVNVSAEVPVMQRMGNAFMNAVGTVGNWLQDHLLD